MKMVQGRQVLRVHWSSALGWSYTACQTAPPRYIVAWLMLHCPLAGLQARLI